MKKTSKTFQDQNIVRSDLNLEKWNLFGTQRSKGQRIIKRVIPASDGSTITQTVTIGLKGSSETLTAEDAKFFYLFLYQWDKNGRSPDGTIHGSFRSIFCDYKGFKGGEDSKVRFGNWEKKWFRKKLQKLMSIPIVYENAYQEKDGTRRDVVAFQLIKSASLFMRKKEFNPKQLYFDLSNFTIHEVIVKSILNQHIKPILLDVITRLKGELSVILYRHLDLIMADKNQFARKLEEFQNDFGIGASRKDNFVKQMRQACKELEGRDITTGRLEYCRIERTEDGRQWKLVVRKSKRIPLVLEAIAPNSTEDDFDNLLAAAEAFLAAMSESNKAEIESIRAEIIRDKYKSMGSEMTSKSALIDAIAEFKKRLHQAEMAVTTA